MTTIVDSSMIETITYHARERTMDVRFHNGRLYRYYNISRRRRNAIRKAESVGKAFIKKVRKYAELYPYEVIE